jgi:hypothetical protein
MLSVRDRVLQVYETAGTFIVPSILILCASDSDMEGEGFGSKWYQPFTGYHVLVCSL